MNHDEAVEFVQTAIEIREETMGSHLLVIPRVAGLKSLFLLSEIEIDSYDLAKLANEADADNFREIVQLYAFKRAHYTKLVRLYREKNCMSLNNWHKLESLIYDVGIDFECAMMHLYTATTDHEFAMGIIGAINL